MLLQNKYNPYLMNTEILNNYKYLASSIEHAWNVTSKKKNSYNPYLMNTEILNYYKYLASSIQLSWNVTCEQIRPIPDEYRNLELL